MKEYKFEEPVFRTCRQLFIGMSEEEFNRLAGEDPHEKDRETGTLACTVFREGTCLVWLNPKEDRKKYKIALLHELCHVVSRWLKDRGIYHTDEAGEEAFAFMYEYYATQLVKHKLI